MEIEVLLKRLDALEERLVEVQNQNTQLKAKVTFLEERLAKYENPKNSRNSSIPPSKDENRPKPNQSLRKASGKKPGGQKGREGKTLEMTAFADKIIKLQPDFCRNCGESLMNKVATKEQSRQTVDLPPIKAIYTEYQTYSKVCNCGCQNTADFPQGVNSPVSYGENIRSLIAYFHTRQVLPFARMKETLNNVFGVNISEGGIHYLLNNFAEKATPMYELIKQRVQHSPVVGTDETGIKVNGKKHWFWTWQTPKLTFIVHSDNRGSQTINREFPQGFPQSTLVHDGWRAQIKTISKNHQTCLAHLARILNYLDQRYPNNEWCKGFKKILSRSLDLKEQLDLRNLEHQKERTSIVQDLEYLLDKPPDKKHKELFTFYKRICRERQYLFTFLFLVNVPPDNNASERAIRNVKVKQKISGQFKLPRAAQNFAIIRSVIDTTIKSGMNVLDSLALIAKFDYTASN